MQAINSLNWHFVSMYLEWSSHANTKPDSTSKASDRGSITWNRLYLQAFLTHFTGKPPFPLGTAKFPSNTAMPPPTLTFSHNIVHKKLPCTHRINSSFDRHKKTGLVKNHFALMSLLKLIQEKLPHLVPGLQAHHNEELHLLMNLDMKNNPFCWVEHPESSSPKHQNLL